MTTTPVFFAAEIMPYEALMSGTAPDGPIETLHNEIKTFFGEDNGFVIHDGSSLVGLTYDESAANPELPVVIATLVGGFPAATEQESLDRASAFKSKHFEQVKIFTDPSLIDGHPTGQPESSSETTEPGE